MCMCMGGLIEPNLWDRNHTLDSRKPDVDGTCSSNITCSQPNKQKEFVSSGWFA